MQKNIIYSSENNEFIILDSFSTGEYLTFGVKIKSGNFSGVSSFCNSNEEIKKVIQKLLLMHSSLNGACTLKDCDSDAYITIEMQKHGQVKLFGQIGGTHQDHFMRFSYALDQTIFIPFIDFLSSNVYF